MSQSDEPADLEKSAGQDALVTPVANAVEMEKAKTLGQTLRTAREAAGLSIDEVAQSLKFSPRQVELLEADNYAALPGNTIVRGFTRSYARLLKLDVNVLLSLLDAATPSAPADVRPPENMGSASEAKGLKQMSLMTSVAIVVALAALLLAAWHFLKPQPAQSPVAADTSRAQQDATIPATVAAPPVNAPTMSPVAGVGSAGEVAAPQGMTGPTLQFSFSDKSWLEVTDATGRAIHSAENLPGSQLTLTGKPPFDIVIGNAGKVKLTYGERQVDLAPFTRADVARLKLE